MSHTYSTIIDAQYFPIAFFFSSGEARKRFKTYVNVLSTIKNEQNEKYLILRKKYINECPEEDNVNINEKNASTSFIEAERADTSSRSNISGNDALHFQNTSNNRNPMTPPPYKPPPVVTPNQNYKLCVDEFKFVLNSVDNQSPVISAGVKPIEKSLEAITECTNENVPKDENNHVVADDDDCDSNNVRNSQCNVISVREATKKFNRIASQEDASIIKSSPVNYYKKSGIKNVSTPSSIHVMLQYFMKIKKKK